MLAFVRAAQYQAQLHRVTDPGQEMVRLLASYGLIHTPADWHEYGGLALHLSVAYPPDLALALLYSIREVKPRVQRDPRPFVLKALEEMVEFRVSTAPVPLQLHPNAELATRGPEDRARRAAQILAREISSLPLRQASSIWDIAGPRSKPFLREALESFNPRAAAILAQARPS
jgi:hypothetical protein